MNLKTIIIVVSIILGVVGFLVLTEPKETQTSEPSNHTTGAGTTGVTLTEFGDFQCPGCASYYPVVKQVKEEYGDKITFRFVHFPLESIHPNARAAARAAEAASRQGKFWEMHDQLFEYQSQWQDTNDPITTFKSYAVNLGLDEAQFETDYKDSAIAAIVSADLKLGREKGVSSTPTFMLNDEVINPAGGLEAFRTIIDQKIEELTGQKADRNSTEDQTTE